MKNIRADFPQLETLVHGKPLIYLDSAASTLKTKSVIDEVNQHYSREVSNIHRGVHYLSESGTIKYENTRKKLASFLNADHEYEIIFTKGTTDSINLVASSFGEEFINEGDEILISTMEHHSNIVPWQIMAEKKGAVVREIPIDDNGDIILEEYEKLLTDKVKLVSVVYISNSLGTINPVKEMIAMAKKKGSYVMLDAAQAIAHTRVDVKDLDCDFLAFSGHKMFGPTGTGILYGKEELLNKMPPYQGGGDMIDVVTIEKTTYNDLPHKFEAGTPHIAGFIGLGKAIDYITDLGFEEIARIEHEVLSYATSRVSEIDKVRLIGTAKNKCSVLSFVIDGAHPHDLGTLLDRQGIAVRTGHHCTQPLMKRFGITGTTRASFSIYNNKEEVDEFIKGLIKACELL